MLMEEKPDPNTKINLFLVLVSFAWTKKYVKVNHPITKHDKFNTSVKLKNNPIPPHSLNA